MMCNSESTFSDAWASELRCAFEAGEVSGASGMNCKLAPSREGSLTPSEDDVWHSYQLQDGSIVVLEVNVRLGVTNWRR